MAVHLVSDGGDDRLVPASPEDRSKQRVAAPGTADTEALEGGALADDAGGAHEAVDVALVQGLEDRCQIGCEQVDHAGLEAALTGTRVDIEERHPEPGLEKVRLADLRPGPDQVAHVHRLGLTAERGALPGGPVARQVLDRAFQVP